MKSNVYVVKPYDTFDGKSGLTISLLDEDGGSDLYAFYPYEYASGSKTPLIPADVILKLWLLVNTGSCLRYDVG